MKRLARNASVAATLLAFTACTMLQPIDDFSPSRIRANVNVGDRVHIVSTTGTTYDLDVIQMGDDFLRGRTTNGKQYRVPYEAMRSIEVERVSGWASAGAIFGSAVIAVYVVTIVALVAFFESLD